MSSNPSYDAAKEQAAQRADSIIAMLALAMIEIEALVAECRALAVGKIDRAGLTLDAIGDAFSSAIPSLAPNLGEYKETCGALAALLFGSDYAGRWAGDQAACFIAEEGFQIAQIFTRAELGQAKRSGGHPVYYFLQAAAIVALRTAANPSAKKGDAE